MNNNYFRGNILAKFCTLGLVTSRKWYSTYVIIDDNYLYLYESGEVAELNPSDTILKFKLTKENQTSKINKKNYSKDKMKIIELFTFNVEISNGVFSSYKIIKFGLGNKNIADEICKAINNKFI